MHGALADTPPADLFARLAEQSATGTLSLTGPDGEATVRWVHGTIAGVRPPADRDDRSLRLGERLVHAGRLQPDDLDRVLAEQAAATAPVALGQLLVDRGLVPPDVVRVLLQEQALDALEPLLDWRAGQYAFDVDPTPPAGVQVALPVDRTLLELRRRVRERDRVRALVPDPAAVPRPGSSPSPDTRMSPDAVAVLAAVDGRSSVDGIAATLGYGYDEASRIVYRLALQGLVAVADDQSNGPADAGRPPTPRSEAPMRPAAEPTPDTSAPPVDDDEPQPWVGWAQGAPVEDEPDPTVTPGAPTGGTPGAPTPPPGEPPAPEPSWAPATADEDVRRALFSELHAVSRAEPDDRARPRPAAPPAGPAEGPPESGGPAPEEQAPEVEEPDEAEASRMPDLSSDEVSSLLRELHDLNRGED